MARTRGATSFHQDDGELLDKEGKPLPTSPEAFQQAMTATVPVAAPAAAPVLEYNMLCDPTTWHRNMTGWEAIQLVNTLMGGMSAVLDPEQWMKLPADLRQHWRRVPVEPKSEE